MLSNILTSVVVVSLISFVGALTLAIKSVLLRKLLLFFVAFSTGALIGDAFIHLLPEVAKGGDVGVVESSAILAGILAFFALEKFLRWRHCHDIDCVEHPKHLGVMNLFGDAFHNFVDGLLIASSFLVSLPLGFATSLAVVLHEVPQELGDFGVLLHSGFSVRRAIYFNFLSASAAIVGALVAYFVGQSADSFVQFMIPFTLGGFVYIALSGLIPELHKEESIGKSSLQFVSMVFGIGVMYLLLLLE